MGFSGQTIKQFKILQPIGKGGMGEVYIALDTVLNRKVAIKFLTAAMKEDPLARQHLLREARAAAALDHPFICKVYETGEVESQTFIAMEYVEGKNLRERLDEGPLEERESLQIGLEIAEALEKAHERGILHRDLKPANIMLTPQGHVKVMDFGLAKRFAAEGESLAQTITQAATTEEGAISGTLAYMSPEQARGEKIDQRSDIFSLGIIIHEMITGKHPFLRTSPLETLTAILRDPPPSTRFKSRAAFSTIDRVMRKALAKEPSKRYQQVTDLLNDIKQLDKEVAAKPHLLSRRFALVAGGILALAVLAIGIRLLTLRTAVRTAGAAPEPISVLVADFQNGTGDPLFDDTLEKSLSIGLESSSHIDIYERTNARGIAEKIDPEVKGKLATQMAQLIAVRENIKVVVDGSIQPKGEGYTIKVRALDPVDSETVADVSETIKAKVDWFKAMASLATKVRSKLGGVPSGLAKELSKETFTTTSLEAMKAYSRAQELNRIGQREEAIKEYLRAIQEDPNFGRAYSGLALIYYNRGQEQEAEQYFQKAMAQIDRMSEREKYRTRGIYYLINRNTQKAIEEYSALVEKFPADSAGQTNLALAYFWAHDFAHAVEVSRQAVELQPNNIFPRYNLVWSALAVGDFALAEQEARQVLEINPDFDEAYVCLALCEVAQGRPDKAAEIYGQLRDIGPMAESLALLGYADLALYEGLLTDAKKYLEEGIAFDLKEGRKEYAAYKQAILAQTHAHLGERKSALELSYKALRESQKLCLRYFIAQAYLLAGHREEAQTLAAELGSRLQAEPRACALLIEGELAMARKNIPEAMNLFQQAQGLLDTWLGRFNLGRAYIEAGAFAEAHSEFEWCLKHRGEATSVFFDDFPSYRYFPPVHYYMGRAQEGLGSPASSESYKKFLEIKIRADSRDPLVEDARRRLATAEK